MQPTDPTELQHLLQLLADKENHELGIQLAKSVGWNVAKDLQFKAWQGLNVEGWQLFDTLQVNIYEKSAAKKVLLMLQNTGHFLKYLQLRSNNIRLEAEVLEGLVLLNLSRFTRLCNLHIIGAEQFVDTSKLPAELLRLAINTEALPTDIDRLQNLRNLTLQGGKNIELPSAISRIKNLCELRILACPLLRLPDELGNLSHLHTLVCDWLSLEEIPAWAHRFAPKELVGDFAPRRKGLPKNIHLLGEKVEVLRIYYEAKARNNRQEAVLAQLSEEIFYLPALSSLNITLSRIEQIPESIAGARSLKAILMPNNQLKSLPAGIARMNNLRRLEAPDNQIEELLHPIPAQRILLQNNPIVHIGEGFAAHPSAAKLTDLNLSHTKISELPANFGNFCRLERLHLLHTGLSALPASFSDLQELKYLELSHTKLAHLPAALGDLGKLEYLDCSACDIVQFAAERGQNFALSASLKMLRLSQNRFLGDSSAQERGRLQSERLENLYISGCGWTEEAMGADFFADLPNLQHIDLSRNKQLRRLPASFFDLQRLESVDLKYLHAEDIFADSRWQGMQHTALTVDIKGSYSAQQVRDWSALLPKNVRIVRH